MVGIDLAKRVFQVHGAAADGSVVFRKKFSRTQLHFWHSSRSARWPWRLATSHYWGREIARLGHSVRLIPPIYVKPFVKRQKNDAADAEGIAAAACRPTMRFVSVKTEDQQARAQEGFLLRLLVVGGLRVSIIRRAVPAARIFFLSAGEAAALVSPAAASLAPPPRGTGSTPPSLAAVGAVLLAGSLAPARLDEA